MGGSALPTSEYSSTAAPCHGQAAARHTAERRIVLQCARLTAVHCGTATLQRTIMSCPATISLTCAAAHSPRDNTSPCGTVAAKQAQRSAAQGRTASLARENRSDAFGSTAQTQQPIRSNNSLAADTNAAGRDCHRTQEVTHCSADWVTICNMRLGCNMRRTTNNNGFSHVVRTRRLRPSLHAKPCNAWCAACNIRPATTVSRAYHNHCGNTAAVPLHIIVLHGTYRHDRVGIAHE